MSGVVSLNVLEAYTNDVTKAVSRIDNESMGALGASTGDVIEIKGKKRTVAKCLPLNPSDEGKGIIRIDGLVRNNAGVAIGDTVVVKKIKAVPAEKVIIAPLEAIPPIDERYLADALENLPLIKGDSVIVPYFGGRLDFLVIGTTPEADAVLVNKKTIFHIDDTKLTVERIKADSITIDTIIEKIDGRIKEHEITLRTIFESQIWNEPKLIETYDAMLKLKEIRAYFLEHQT